MLKGFRDFGEVFAGCDLFAAGVVDAHFVSTLGAVGISTSPQQHNSIAGYFDIFYSTSSLGADRCTAAGPAAPYSKPAECPEDFF